MTAAPRLSQIQAWETEHLEAFIGGMTMAGTAISDIEQCAPGS
jgi:hypothetical protein